MQTTVVNQSKCTLISISFHSPNLLKIKSFPLERMEPSDVPPSPVPPPPMALCVKSENFCIREPGASVRTPGNLLVMGLALVAVGAEVEVEGSPRCCC